MQEISPFFILANPRSGSSLFRIMLDSHPEIVIPPEGGFMEWLFEKYKNWETTQIENFITDVLNSKKFETWGLTKSDLENFFQNNSIENYQQAVQAVYYTFALKFDKKPFLWGDKNNYFISILSKLNQIFPNAKYIHLIRDGRDVATSYRELQDVHSNSNYIPKLSKEITEIAEEWKNNNKNISDFIQNKCHLIVRFEDLVLNVDSTLKEVCRFLEIDFSEEMLDYHIRNQQKKIEPEELLAWKKKTLEKPDSTRINKYKTELTPEEIKLFQEKAKDVLMTHNYRVT